MSQSPANVGVFVVEDHGDTLRVLTKYLERKGFRVCAASSMAEALDRLPDSGCKILLSDIGLPDGSGWDLLKQVSSKLALYAIAVTGYGTNSDKRRSADAGYNAHLLKPLDEASLSAALAAALTSVKASARGTP